MVTNKGKNGLALWGATEPEELEAEDRYDTIGKPFSAKLRPSQLPPSSWSVGQSEERPAKRAGWAPAMLALAACGLCYLAGWQGTDWAAQVYRATESARHGLILWDPGWYGGTFPLNYSLLYPLASGWLGNWPVAAVSAAVAAFCWDRLVTPSRGRGRLTSWYFAASTVVEVAIGQLPTLTGEALGLAAMLMVVRYLNGPRRSRLVRAALVVGAMLLGMAAGLTSPVVGSFLALTLGAWAVSGISATLPPDRAVVVPGAAALATFSATAVLPLLFAAPGYFPFIGGDLAIILAVCAFLALQFTNAPRPIRATAVIYALVSTALFLTPNQMGDNGTRFAAYIGVPLVLYYLLSNRSSGASKGWRAKLPALRLPGGWPVPPPASLGIAVVIAVGLVAWAWSPIIEAVSAEAHGPPSTAAYYRPLLSELSTLSHDHVLRVEVPPTLHHWEAAYVAPTFPLARGWERQLDEAYNPIFYVPGALSARSYRSWLLANGVSYVALPDARLDYAGVAEASLLRSGTVKGLQPVWQDSHWRLWRVQGSTGLASPPAQVVTLGPAEATVRFSRPGTAQLKLRWSAHWSLTPAETATACLAQAPGQWTWLRSGRAGGLRLMVSLGDGDHGRCES